jgi:hypothetical protein
VGRGDNLVVGHATSFIELSVSHYSLIGQKFILSESQGKWMDIQTTQKTKFTGLPPTIAGAFGQ